MIVNNLFFAYIIFSDKIFSNSPRQSTIDSSSEGDANAAASVTESQAPPGMSEAAVKRVKGDSPLESNKFEQVLNT